MNRNRAPSGRAEALRSRLGGAVSLEWKLPLLMTAVLAVGLATSLAVTYHILTIRESAVVRDRLAHAVREVAGNAERSLAQRAAALGAVARDGAVVRALLDAPHGSSSARDLAAARGLLARLMLARDTSLAIELRDASGRLVATTSEEPGRDARLAPALERAMAGAGESAGAVRFSALEAAGRRVRFWCVAPVMVAGEQAGFVAQPLYVASPSGAMRMMRELTREDIALYTRNVDGSVWAGTPGVPAPAPMRRDSTPDGITLVRPGVGPVLAAESRVAGTPWVMVLESPLGSVLARPRGTVGRLLVLSLVIILGGMGLSWLVSRRLTRPLATLTAAAEAVATGTYEHAVAGAGRDEIGRLAASFHAMARQVTAARRELEGRVADAQGAAAQLELANRQLRDAIAAAEEARAEAVRARVDAERANRAKGDFLATMSHELRTPLNAIGGYTQLIELGLYGPLTEAQREALARIGRSQTHLLTLIDDVLSFARIDAGQVRYTMGDVPLHDSLAELEALVAPAVRACHLVLEPRGCDPMIVVRADRDKLRQVVLNLLSNAIKYTPAGGRVTVECEADEREVRVRVRDTGTGIPAERLPAIFEPFVQGERALNRPDEGVGLGLAISRDLARGMGGRLTAESEVGQGSTFTLVLPRGGMSFAGERGEGEARRGEPVTTVA